VGSSARLIVLVSLIAAAWVPAATQAPAEVDALMARIADRVAVYQREVQRVMCLERYTVQPIQANLALDGFARTVESDLRIEEDAQVSRRTLRVNGRPPRERDIKSRAGCTDPNPLSPEPLAFLLPPERGDYRFTSMRRGKERERTAWIVDFASTTRRSRLQLIEDERGHDDCFDWTGPLATKGRLWVDAVTLDVLRVERYLTGPVDVQVPAPLQRRYQFGPWITLDRNDETIRYTTVVFHEPDEVMLLPESIESLTVMRNSLQSMRRTQTFTGYRRFMAEGRLIRKGPPKEPR
jgi:hypothetical protein